MFFIITLARWSLTGFVIVKPADTNSLHMGKLRRNIPAFRSSGMCSKTNARDFHEQHEIDLIVHSPTRYQLSLHFFNRHDAIPLQSSHGKGTS
jgi:hypothetical protein